MFASLKRLSPSIVVTSLQWLQVSTNAHFEIAEFLGMLSVASARKFARRSEDSTLK